MALVTYGAFKEAMTRRWARLLATGVVTPSVSHYEDYLDEMFDDCASFCAHCFERKWHHAEGGKCLFEPTTFEPVDRDFATDRRTYFYRET